MTDTPETDHLQSNLDDAVHPILSSFCRKLERERNEARELLREIRDDEVNAQDECDKFLRDHVPSELSKVTEQRDRLAEALEYILGIGLTEKTKAKAEKALQIND